MRFFSTFVSGTQEIIADILRAHRAGKVTRVLDGAVLYEHTSLLNLPCFNNTFEVIAQRKGQGRGMIDRMLASLIAEGDALPLPRQKSKRLSTFRIVVSDMNSLVPIAAGQRDALEKIIARKTGLRSDRVHPHIEYWILSRSEGLCLFLRRITNSRIGEKQLEKGELKPELAFLMNWLSSPDKRDTYLDPFCGSGALLLSRARMGAFAQLLGSDIAGEKVRRVAAKARAQLGGDMARVTLKDMDIAALPQWLEAGSIRAIVTDPPWGFYEDIDVRALYRRMLDVFAHLTAPGARLVLLSAQKALLEQALGERAATFAPDKRYDILVSGKKAAIYRIIRK